MTNDIYIPLESDFKRYKSIIHMLIKAQELTISETLEESIESDFYRKAISVKDSVRESASGIPMVYGSILLLAVSTFEKFIRNIVEDIAMSASLNSESFHHLPAELKNNLQRYSALIISEPKKYRSERYLKQIAETLSKNLSGTSNPGEINHKSISITFENMRPDTIDELFKRLGIQDFWDRIPENPRLKIFLEALTSEEARSNAKKQLNSIIDERNKISHQSSNVTWPSQQTVINSIEFLEKLSLSVSEYYPIFCLDLKKRTQSKSAPQQI